MRRCAVVTLGMVGDVAMPAVLVDTGDGHSDADHAAADEGERAQDDQETSRHLPHARTLSRPMRLDNRSHATKSGLGSSGHSRTPRSRSALPITETELNAIASAAMIGLSIRPNAG